MTFSEFTKQLPVEFTEQEFVDLMNRVIDLKSVVDMPEAERDALFDGAQYLVDFILLVREVKGELHSAEGHPVLAYRGPFVPNALTRPDGLAPDPKALDTLGVGEGERYFGG